MLGSIPDMLSSAKLLPVVCQYSSYHFRMSQVVKEAILSVDGYNADRREAVRKAAQGLNLKKEAAMTIFSKAVCLSPKKCVT